MKYFYHFSIACFTQLFTIIVSTADAKVPLTEAEIKDAIIPSDGSQVLTSGETGV
jgi:hypothetical protein